MTVATASAHVRPDLADWQLREAAEPEAAPVAMRASLAEYIYGTFPGEYDMAPHHRLIIEHLEAVERGEIRRLMVRMPPSIFSTARADEPSAGLDGFNGSLSADRVKTVYDIGNILGVIFVRVDFIKTE